MTGMLALVATGAMVLLAVGGAWAGTPTEDLRGYTDRVLQIMQDPALSAKARKDAVRDVAVNAFDVSETAKRALGTHWQKRTPAERDEFVGVFRDLLEQTYVSRLDEYGGERIRYVSERVDGDNAVVRAAIVTRTGTEVPVESRLLARQGRWLIYDILIENVSLVANYRSQFDRVIRSESYEELVKRLRARVEALGTGKAKASPASR